MIQLSLVPFSIQSPPIFSQSCQTVPHVAIHVAWNRRAPLEMRGNQGNLLQHERDMNSKSQDDKRLILLVIPDGFEPSASGLGILRSILLSYGTTWGNPYKR
jgi:hypothetical protein